MWHSPALKMVLTRFHTKNYPGTEPATGWEEGLLEDWGQDRTESVPKPKGCPPRRVTSSMTGISQSMQKVTVLNFIKEMKPSPCSQQGRPPEAKAMGELESREQRGLTAFAVCCSSSALHAVSFPQRWVKSKFSASPSCSSSLSV